MLESRLTSALRVVRQPRYAALSVLMVVVALICIAAGTWQIARLDGKVAANDALRANAHQRPVPVSRLLPLIDAKASVAESRVRYRTVTASGTYDTANQSLVRNRSVDDRNGLLVLTPLHTKHGDLLVVRGFVTSASLTPPRPPGGPVSVRARVQLAESRHDGAAQLPGGQVESINPDDQQRRLGSPVYDGYVELLAGQPGVSGLTAIPGPDLSNPAGGAVEPQHFAYILQWYLFALLALAAPFAMARAERREHAAAELDGDDPQSEVAAKLADRYGRSLR